MLTVSSLRKLYTKGLFPMANGSGPHSAVNFYLTERRSVILPASMHVPRRLKRLIRQAPFTFRWNDDIRAVMTACNASRPKRQHWINDEMIDAYETWHKATGEAYCLSVFQGDRRVAGLFGVHLGGAMAAAEGMYSSVSNAGSIGIVTLVAGMARAGIQMIDLQYGNNYTEQFGLTELTAQDYLNEMSRLNAMPVRLSGDYFDAATGISFVQSLSQTS